MTVNQQLVVQALMQTKNHRTSISIGVHTRIILHRSIKDKIYSRRGCSTSELTMIRNIDLPEALVFYGTNTVFHNPDNSIRPGVTKLMTEAKELGTVCILLSESMDSKVLKDRVEQSDLSGQNLIVRSSLEIDDGIGYSPSPLALLESITSVMIEPRGFGGSSGFGTKMADPERSPLPKHW